MLLRDWPEWLKTPSSVPSAAAAAKLVLLTVSIDVPVTLQSTHESERSKYLLNSTWALWMVTTAPYFGENGVLAKEFPCLFSIVKKKSQKGGEVCARVTLDTLTQSQQRWIHSRPPEMFQQPREHDTPSEGNSFEGGFTKKIQKHKNESFPLKVN